MPKASGKFVAKGSFYLVDADKVEETEDFKVLTADERLSIEKSAADVQTVRGQATTTAQQVAGVNNNPEGTNEMSGTVLPELRDIEEMPLAVVDANGNMTFGIDDDATLSAVMWVFQLLKMNTFEIGRESSEHPFAIQDKDGNLGFAVTEAAEALIGGGARLGGESDWDFAVVDKNDNVGFGIKDGIFFWPQQTFSQIGVADLDRRNKAFSQSVRDTVIVSVQQPTATYNVVVNWGQSLSAGQQAFPSLSKTPEPGAMMIGDNVDNVSGSNTYEVIGPLQFNPLVAYTHNGSVNLDAAGEAALSPGDPNIGEPPVIGLTNGLKRAMNRRALAENDGHNLVAISPAIGGQPIEDLLPTSLGLGDGVDRYSILTDGIDKVVALAGADTCVVPIVTWLQGEWNYDDHGASYNRATYDTLLRTMFDTVSADAIAATGQTFGPLFVTYQTGAAYTRDADEFGAPGLHVGMAQLDVALDRPDTVMAGPIYPYTDRGGHLEPNGSRWFGHQMAKVGNKVMLEGQDWQPLRPIEILQDGTEILISFHVPVAPLTFDTPYVGTVATDYAARGFRVSSADDATDYPITDVEIVADTVIRLTLASEPPADALVWYADKTVHGGNGNIRDSDRTVAFDAYEYAPDRGAYETDNVPALVDKPYALHNWCVAFCQPINYSEF